MTRATSASRWSVVAAYVFAPTLTLAAATSTHAPTDGKHVDLYEDGVAVTGTGIVLCLPADADATYLDGSRVLDLRALPTDDASSDDVPFGCVPDRLGRIAGPTTSLHALKNTSTADAAATESRRWLASGVVPGGDGPFADLGETALLDVRALTLANGASIAAPSPRWRYVWPRDASFTAAALARTGHVDDAVRVLRFLQEVQGDDGSFHARYLPDGSGVPDDRGVQSDGTGWVLWSLAVVLDAADADERDAIVDSLRGLLDTSTDHLLDLTEGTDPLPPPSSDYWERRPTSLTLGTAAPLLAGLHGASSVYAEVAFAAERHHDDAGDLWDRAAATAMRATVLRTAIEDAFEPAGYPRHVTGGDHDAAVAFTLPPFQPTPLRGGQEARTATIPGMLRPAGGLAPGEGWHDDGISWTPQTALYALTAAASGTPEGADEAREWLRWLDEHRTASGAIPEKVLADGSPAAVAPLGWSASLVVLTLAELDDAE